MIANRPDYYAQVVAQIPMGGTPEQAAARIARKIEALVADTGTSAAALVMPGLATLGRLTNVVLALGAQPGWSVTTTFLQDTPAGEMVAVHVTRQIPFNDGTCPSEALVLGPFDEFPPTRKSPIPALEIYVGEPRAADPKTNNPTTKANLAHLEMNFDSDFTFKKVWNMSCDGRLSSLGNREDSRAKAKVSFVIPRALANRLGCSP